MRRKISNPFVRQSGYDCFCCSPQNPIGLKLEFWYDDEFDTVETEWNPGTHYQGYVDVLHGGIQSTIMDEVASWSVYIFEESSGVTGKMEIHYKKPVLISKGKIIVKSKVYKRARRIVTLSVELFDGSGVLCTKGLIDYFVFPKEKAEKDLGYPGIKAFLP
ncbi:MAG TPA: PaaI family thioesterase [Tenuifilaceae bacterium]|nr:PaaI family thioesterase [Tenuifilaceae bacterium]